MTTITIPWNTANVNGLAAIIPTAAAKNEIADVLKSVKIDSSTMATTDRYAAAEWSHGGTGDENASILVPVDAAKWLASQAVSSLVGGAAGAKAHDRQGDIVLVITSENCAGTLSIRMIGEDSSDYRELVGMTFIEVEGRYPAIARLFPDYIEPDDNAIPVIGLNAKLLARASKAVDKVTTGKAIMRMQFQANNGSPMPGPVLITATDNTGLRYLLMPTRIA